MTTENQPQGGSWGIFKKLPALVAALLLCGTLAADIKRNFSPPLECDGGKAVELDKNYKLDPVRGATFVFT